MIKVIDMNSDLIGYTFGNLDIIKDTDLSNNIIIFPTRRLTTFFYKKLSDSIKDSFIPPLIYTIDDFVNTHSLLIDKKRGFIDRFKAVEIIYDLIKRKFDTDFYLKNLDNFLDFFKWGNRLFSVFEEIIIESENYDSIDFRTYNEFVNLGDYHNNYKQFISILPRLINDYMDYLNENDIFTRALSYKFLKDNKDKLIELINDKKVIISGFGFLNYTERTIFKSIIDNKNNLMIFKARIDKNNDFSYPFEVVKESINCLEKEFEYEGEKGEYWSEIISKVSLNKSSDIEDEMNFVYKKLNDIKDIEPLKIGVVLSNPSTLFPFIQSVISKFGEKKISFNITIGYPFKRVPLFNLIQSIYEVFKTKEGNKYYSIAFIDLIRHPYIKAGMRDDFFRTIHRIENVLKDKNLIFFEKKELINLIKESIDEENNIDKNVVINDTELIFNTFILDDFKELEEFKNFFKNLFETIEENGAKGFLFLKDYLLNFNLITDEFFKAFNSDFLQTSLVYNKERFFKFFVDFVSSNEIHLSGSPLKGVQVMGLLEFRGLSFDRVFILDVNEGINPDVNRFDPLLPYDIRRIFKINTYKEREKIYAYNFYSVIHNSKSADLFWIDDEGEMERSRYVERIIYESEKRSREIEIQLNSYDFDIFKYNPEYIEKNELVKNKIRNFEFSPTSLESYLECPAKFYFSKVLGLKEKTEIEEIAESNQIGTIVHNVLKIIYEKMNYYKALDISDYLDQLIENEFKKLSVPIKGLNILKYYFIRDRLEDFLKYDFKRINENFIKVKDLEKKVGYVYKFRKNGREYTVSFKGYIDRIEKEGEIKRIIDYKTGKEKTVKLKNGLKYEDFTPLIDIKDEKSYFKELENILNKFRGFQVLLYLLIYNKFGKDYSNSDGGYIYFKKDNEINSVFSEKIVKNEIMYVFKNVLEDIIVDIYERAKFLRTEKEGICEKCVFKNICKKYGVKTW